MRKFLSIILAITILTLSFSTIAFGEETALTPAQKSAAALQSLNLFKGTDLGFELDREPTRMECIVTIIRLLGEENAALSCTDKHPFTDIPEWADRYAAYAYKNGITKGISETEFGYSVKATRQQFAALLLRTLSYSETDKDFTYETAEADGLKYKIIDETVNSDKFLRGDMVIMTYLSLFVNVKNTSKPLSDSLMAKNVFTKDLFEKTTAIMGGASQDKPANSGNNTGSSHSGSNSTGSSHSSGNNTDKPDANVKEQREQLPELIDTVNDYYGELSNVIDLVESEELHAWYDEITKGIETMSDIDIDSLSDSAVSKYFHELTALFDDMEMLAITIAIER